MSKCSPPMRTAFAPLLLLGGLALPQTATAAEPIAVFLLGAEEQAAPALPRVQKRFEQGGRFVLRPWTELQTVMRAPAEATEMASDRRARLLQEARDRIAKADELLNAFELKKVMPELDAALEKMRLAIRGDSLGDLVALHVKRASLNVSLGSAKGVRDELEDILALKPDFELDAELARPSVVRALKEARQASASRTVLSTMVLSEPSGASVAVDGKTVGNTPVALRNLPAGFHLLEVTQPGHLAWARMIELDVNRTDPIRVDLVYLPGSQLVALRQAASSIDDVEAAASTIDGALGDLEAGMLLFVEGSKAGRYRIRLYDRRQRAFSKLQSAPNAAAGLDIAVDALLRELGPAGLIRAEGPRVIERVIERPTAEAAAPWYQQWWVWAGGAVIIVGGSIAAAVLIEREGRAAPGYDVEATIE